MADQYWVDKNIHLSKPPPDSKYELFAQIGFDSKNIGDMTYYPIIKKRHKKENKPQWYVFTDGEYYKLKRSQAQKDYFPQLLFYRLID